MCQRERCLACAQPDDRPLRDCAHDRLERHDKPHSLTDRTPTKPIPIPTGGAIDVDFADADSAAEFLEMVARILRKKKKLRIMIE